MLGCSFGFIGAALFVGAGAWEVSKQIARLSKLWVRKAVSPFWKNPSENNNEDAVATERLAMYQGTASITSLKRTYFAVAGGLIAAGIVLVSIGFTASGFDATVFSTQIDLHNGTVILGGVEVMGL